MTVQTEPQPTPPAAPTYDIAHIMGSLYGDGILGLKGPSAANGRRS